jgi:fluoroacetyl-CoA thioesterase
MKQLFKVGDKKEFKRKVTGEDFATFHGDTVHPVCATFSLARDIEWTTRQFVLEMRDADEEGVGTFISIQHISPAFEGEEIHYSGYIDELNGNELICSVDVRVGERLIARASTGQKILKREKIKKLFEKP